MSTNLSKIKLLAIGCLSMAAITGAVNVPSASAGDRYYGGGHEDVRGYENDREGVYEHRGIYRQDDGFYQVSNHRRYCQELRKSIYALEREQERILNGGGHYHQRWRWQRLRQIERDLHHKRAEYRRACR